jgi:hypothetical protein
MAQGTEQRRTEVDAEVASVMAYDAAAGGPLLHLGIDFRRETVAGLWKEIQPLLVDHALEIAHFDDIPLSPDKDLYFMMEQKGLARVFTVRRADGEHPRGARLIGYAIFFVRHAMHYQTSLQAQEDIIFIAKEERGFGGRFIAWCDEQLRAEGVQVVYHHVKAAHNWGKVLERQGYELVDLIFAKRLDK